MSHIRNKKLYLQQASTGSSTKNKANSGKNFIKTIVSRILAAVKPTTRSISSQNVMSSVSRETIVNYLINFRKGGNPSNTKVNVNAEVIPFTGGVVLKLEFGDRRDNIFYDRCKTLNEVSEWLAIDLYAAIPGVINNEGNIKGTYMFLSGNILYLIKNDAPENWCEKVAQSDLEIISRYIKSKLGIF